MDRNQKEVMLARCNTFPNQIVIVDGQGRSGKNLIAVLLSTMDKMGKMRLDSQIDYIPRYWSLGKMTEDAAIIALRTEFDEKLYYDSMSRDVNFRWDDYTGVFKQGNRLEYIRRLFIEPGPKLLQKIIDEKRIFQEMTHDGIQFFDLYVKALGDRLKFIHVLRNPIHNIYEQNRRGLGQRIGSDPTELQLTFNYKNNLLPLMALGYEELWCKGSELERLTVMADAMFRKNINALKKFSNAFGKQIFVLEFDQFVQDPTRYLHKLENFVGEQFCRSTNRILRREKCPRTIPEEFVSERAHLIRSQIGGEYQLILDKMVSEYNQQLIEMNLK